MSSPFSINKFNARRGEISALGVIRGMDDTFRNYGLTLFEEA